MDTIFQYNIEVKLYLRRKEIRTMKKSGIAALLTLAAALLLTASACSGEPEDLSNTPALTPAAEQAPMPIGDEQTDVFLTAEEKLSIAKSYIDAPVEDLIAEIGEPVDRDYAPSCMGSGDDGNLYYDGFTVYTYREGDSEVVIDVE